MTKEQIEQLRDRELHKVSTDDLYDYAMRNFDWPKFEISLYELKYRKQRKKLFDILTSLARERTKWRK